MMATPYVHDTPDIHDPLRPTLITPTSTINREDVPAHDAPNERLDAVHAMGSKGTQDPHSPYTVAIKTDDESSSTAAGSAPGALATHAASGTTSRTTTRKTFAQHPLALSPACRERLFAIYPGLRSHETFRRLFVYLLIPGSIVHDDTLPGAIPIPRDRLAWIEQKNDLLPAHRYSGEPFLTAYRQQTGHWFAYREATYLEGGPRMVVDLALKAEVIAALAADITVPMTQVVDVVTGHLWGRDHAVQERQRHYQAAITRRSRYPETNALLDYLNTPARAQMHGDTSRRMGVADSRKDLMRRALARYGAEAAQVALTQEQAARRSQSLGILLAMRLQPLQYYAASRKDNTRRIFPAHTGFGMLPRAVAAVLARDWYDFDLRNAQLAIVASLWNVPAVTAFLLHGGRIWEELCQYLDWPQDAAHKKPVKTALYAIIFGARDRNLPQLIAEEHANHPALAAMGPAVFVERLLRHPLIAALTQRRDIRLAAVEAQGGGYDCYGEYIPLVYESDHRGRRRPQASSVLAQEAQAMEFAIVSAAFALAQTTNEFTIIHWAHDGFSISIRDQRRAASWIAKITASVNERAADYGVHTALELTSAPHA